jgi:hypothetical protein
MTNLKQATRLSTHYKICTVYILNNTLWPKTNDYCIHTVYLDSVCNFVHPEHQNRNCLAKQNLDAFRN